jgi:hypothetical protein
MTKKKILEALFNHAQYIDSRMGNAIPQENWDALAEDLMKKISKKRKINLQVSK